MYLYLTCAYWNQRGKKSSKKVSVKWGPQSREIGKFGYGTQEKNPQVLKSDWDIVKFTPNSNSIWNQQQQQQQQFICIPIYIDGIA